jgi:tRNA (mo5U34)-methyltransferase
MSNSLVSRQWIEAKLQENPYWFLKIELAPGLFTPGWSDPALDKLPYYGLPDDMTGMRVLDIGCGEGFFSFEAERRGAEEVIAVDGSPASIKRFQICKHALNSKVEGYWISVYDLDVKKLGTFDLVMYFGVLYHLKDPLLSFKKIREVCSGTLLVQSATNPELETINMPVASFHPHGIASGPNKEIHDPTVFWLPNVTCVGAMIEGSGFVDIERVGSDNCVWRAKSSEQAKGSPISELEFVAG